MKTQPHPHSNLTCSECGAEASMYIPATDGLMCSGCANALEMQGLCPCHLLLETRNKWNK